MFPSVRPARAALKYPAHFPDLHAPAEDRAAAFGTDGTAGAPHARVYETTLAPGELLLVPPGTAHCAASLGASLMVTHNFIDASPCTGAARRHLAFWRRSCATRPDRILSLFARSDGAGGTEHCRRYVAFLEHEAARERECPPRPAGDPARYL